MTEGIIGVFTFWKRGFAYCYHGKHHFLQISLCGWKGPWWIIRCLSWKKELTLCLIFTGFVGNWETCAIELKLCYNIAFILLDMQTGSCCCALQISSYQRIRPCPLVILSVFLCVTHTYTLKHTHTHTIRRVLKSTLFLGWCPRPALWHWLMCQHDSPASGSDR